MQKRKLAESVLSGVLICIALVLAVIRFREYRESGNAAPGTVRVVSNWQSYAVPRLAIGPATAPVVIVEFSDFLCPYCKKAASDLQKLRAEFGDSVRVIYRHSLGHSRSREFAVAAECAAQQRAFEPVHNAFFAGGELAPTESATEIAISAAGLDTNTMQRCVLGTSMIAALGEDSLAAATLGIRGTPTFLVNEWYVEGSVGVDSMRRVVRKALSSN